MKTKFNKIGVCIFALAILITSVTPALSARPGFGMLYYEGEVVRTIVPPAAITREGIDNLYVIPDQLAVAAVAPGDRDYHGGKWAFHSVEWNVTPYTLTSEEDVLAAEDAGDITITRVPENDFKCPIQP